MNYSIEYLQYGALLSLIGYLIVLFSFLCLYLIFTYFTRIVDFLLLKQLQKSGDIINDTNKISISGEESAAISMALFLHFKEQELHDEESNILTIKQISRIYSPWSSKIHGLRNYNR